MGPVRVHVAYCEGWDPGSRAPAGRLSPATARRRDRDAEQYAALLRTPGGTPLLLPEVARRERFLRVVLLSPDGRRVGRFRYLRKTGPDRLVLLGGRRWAPPDLTGLLREGSVRTSPGFPDWGPARLHDVDLGHLDLPSGDLAVGGGPAVDEGLAVYRGVPPPGRHRVVATVASFASGEPRLLPADFPERFPGPGDVRPATVRIQARDAPVASWEHALQGREDPGELEEREFHGGFAQGGVCLADPGVAERVTDHRGGDFERYELAFCGHGSALEESAADAALRAAARRGAGLPPRRGGVRPRPRVRSGRPGTGPRGPGPDRRPRAGPAAAPRAPAGPARPGGAAPRIPGRGPPVPAHGPGLHPAPARGGTMFVVRPGLISSAPLRIGRDASGAPVRFMVDGRLFGYSAGEARL